MIGFTSRCIPITDITLILTRQSATLHNHKTCLKPNRKNAPSDNQIQQDSNACPLCYCLCTVYVCTRVYLCVSLLALLTALDPADG